MFERVKSDTWSIWIRHLVFLTVNFKLWDDLCLYLPIMIRFAETSNGRQRPTSVYVKFYYIRTFLFLRFCIVKFSLQKPKSYKIRHPLQATGLNIFISSVRNRMIEKDDR